MTRSPCTNHPDADLIEIPPGSRFCTRCRYIVPQNWKPVEVVIGTPLEAEPDATSTLEEGFDLTESLEIEPEKVPLEAKPEVKEQLEESQEETVAEEVAEPIEEEAVVETPKDEAKVEIENLTLDDLAKITAAKNAKIKALRAQLAELEK